MAEVSGDRMITCDSDVPTHVTHMSRLMTVAGEEGFEPSIY